MRTGEGLRRPLVHPHHLITSNHHGWHAGRAKMGHCGMGPHMSRGNRAFQDLTPVPCTAIAEGVALATLEAGETPEAFTALTL